MAVWVLLVPTVTLPKFKKVALELNWPAEMPVPDRATVRAGFKAFETIAIPPLMLPATFGVKRTLKVTLCPLFRLKGRLKPLKLNPAPVAVACEIITGALPEFVNVSRCLWLIPT